MFTGIVQAIGKIVAVRPVEVLWGHDAKASPASTSAQPEALGRRLTVEFGALESADVAIGDSIAINGACMTVVAIEPQSFQVDVSRESLNCTVRLDQPGPVNLEKAMRASDRLGGHLVSGHVDGTAVVRAVVPMGESWQLVVEVPAAMAPYVSEKGSIAIDGVSLTVNRVTDAAHGCEIQINLIPHTWISTTLQFRKPGDRVNVEVDQLAKQVERIVSRMQSSFTQNSQA